MKKLACLLYLAAVCTAVASSACAGKSDDDYKREVTRDMHASIGADLAELAQAARDLQAVAPAHAWDPTQDAAAISTMRDAWLRARVAYELVEGATAPLFPDQDFAMDARYDDYLVELGPDGDADPFDGVGATGMHSIERILFAPEIRDEVIAFERTLPGYRAAAYPATDADAIEFKTELVGQLIADADDLHSQWAPAAIDIGAAYIGLVGLMNEQREKVNLAATGEEESRYANVTLFDLRNNLAGTRKVYELFRAWIAASDGEHADAMIQIKFSELATLYTATSGDALPPVPSTWSSDAPSPADLATPFGMVWQQVHAATDPARSESIVAQMNAIATLLGFPQFVEE
ncbi:MAG TPA: imelysin family protein [Kofleriaceae bacterium]